MHSTTLLLVLLQVLGSAIIFGDAFVMTQKKLPLQKDTHHRIILSGVSNDADEGGISYEALLESREREIELIARLDPDHEQNDPSLSGDANQEIVISELWQIWYSARGPINEQKLRSIEDMLGDQSKWEEAEKLYLQLINEHCKTSDDSKLNLSNWVEPANRLATLLYLMGRLKESLAWCEMIIDAKPWHIGALSGVVMVCLKMNDEESAKKFISMGLPNLSNEMRDKRKAWVEKNVDSAKQSLLQLKSNNAVYEELAQTLEMSSREIAPTIDENSLSAWQ